MPQDQQSGAAAAQWGRETAAKVAKALGATPTSTTSNECLLDGRRVVIKCAAVNTDSVGVTYKMLERVTSVIAAFQQEDGSFDVWELSPQAFKANMRETASRGASAGKVGLVRRAAFHIAGKPRGSVTV